MSWVSEVDATTSWEGVLGNRPELLTRYRAFYERFWRDGLVPVRVLELCRLRIAAIHDCEAERVVHDAAAGVSEAERQAIENADFESFSDEERAALAVAEQMPYAHHQITDADVQRLEKSFGATGAVSLLTALAFFDATSRLKIVLGVEARAAELHDFPLENKALV